MKRLWSSVYSAIEFRSPLHRAGVARLGALCLGAAALGCSSGPSALAPPSIDSDAAASEAMTLYDSNSDGMIADAELDAVPSLKGAMSTVDGNGDGKVAKEEIAARIESWAASKIGITNIKCTVILDGAPLEGAEVTMTPAKFLGTALQAAVGSTSPDGIARPSIPKDKRPTADSPPGLALGFYDVSVTGGSSKKAPARYAEKTPLGIEVALDNPDILNNRVVFKLASK